MESCLDGPPTKPNILPARSTANFHPSIWGDSFISYPSDEATLFAWREKAVSLKREVLKMLSTENHDALPNKRSISKLSFIDAIQRLGVAYHFEHQIENELAYVFTTYHDQIQIGDDDLHTVALRFRLLREHGYNLTCDVFRKFMDHEGNFHKSLCDGVDGLLSLYEASHLRVQGEALLDNALSFATSNLRSLLPRLSPSLAKQVSDALYRPLRKRMQRLEARNYLAIYEENEKRSEVLLQFAKMDFNILQKSHQKELSIISKWWKDLDCPRKFPFARDRIVECYFWILGVYFEPKHARARIFLTQVIAVSSIVDDIYDAHGSKEELELFTEAINRWDASAAVNLPKYTKACYKELLNIYSRAEEELIEQGRPLHGVECAKEAMKRLARAYLEERKWLDTGYTPTIEEYMKVALVTSGYTLLTVSALVLMGDSLDEDVFNWLLNQPKVLNAASVICRLMDDIVSHEFEQERGHPPSAVECYTTQHGVSEEKACEVFRIEIEEAWKDINEAFLRPTPVAVPVLMRVLNLTRMIELLHKESDGYTHVTPEVKENITSVLCTAVEV